MKFEYLENAMRFLNEFSDFIYNWYDEDNIINAIDDIGWHKGYHVSFNYGCTRYVLVGKDFAIKWDYDADSVEELGGCESEYEIYNEVKNTSYSYLFAPITKVEVNNHYFYIMPRIDNIGPVAHHFKTLDEFLTYDEKRFLYNKISDLHDNNWGIKNNKPVIIDYAMRLSMYT